MNRHIFHKMLHFRFYRSFVEISQNGFFFFFPFLFTIYWTLHMITLKFHTHRHIWWFYLFMHLFFLSRYHRNQTFIPSSALYVWVFIRFHLQKLQRNMQFIALNWMIFSTLGLLNKKKKHTIWFPRFFFYLEAIKKLLQGRKKTQAKMLPRNRKQ